MPKERYVQDLRQALTGTETSVTYNFSLTPHPTATTTSTSCTTTTTLAYEKVQKDISVRNAPLDLCTMRPVCDCLFKLVSIS